MDRAEGAAAQLQALAGAVASPVDAAVAPFHGDSLLGAFRNAALAATPEETRMQLQELSGALSALVPPDGSGLPSDPAAHTALLSLLAVSAIALAAKRLLAGSDPDDDVKAGMDEWASLAASEGEQEPSELQEYNPTAIREYFTRRPVTLLKRGARSLALLGSFGFSIYLDKKLLREEPDERKLVEVQTKRAAELRRLLVSLGPTYVKLGQVLPPCPPPPLISSFTPPSRLLHAPNAATQAG